VAGYHTLAELLDVGATFGKSVWAGRRIGRDRCGGRRQNESRQGNKNMLHDNGSIDGVYGEINGGMTARSTKQM
jgi:hypothetical protein